MMLAWAIVIPQIPVCLGFAGSYSRDLQRAIPLGKPQCCWQVVRGAGLDRDPAMFLEAPGDVSLEELHELRPGAGSVGPGSAMPLSSCLLRERRVRGRPSAR